MEKPFTIQNDIADASSRNSLEAVARVQNVQNSDVELGMSVPIGHFSVADDVTVHTLTLDQKDELIEKLNEVLKGELAAVETYDQVLETIDEEKRDIILNFKAEHSDSVLRLKSIISHLGGQHEDSSGAWGVVAQSFTGMAKVFGDNVALRALEEGEELGLSDYESLRDYDYLPSSVRGELDAVLIPRQRHHVEKISDLIQ